MIRKLRRGPSDSIVDVLDVANILPAEPCHTLLWHCPVHRCVFFPQICGLWDIKRQRQPFIGLESAVRKRDEFTRTQRRPRLVQEACRS